MDAFEQIVAMLLHRQGYWVQTSYKVDLSKADKRRMGLHSCPRWEIDVLAYRPVDNEVLAVECKSLLNSPGVRYLSLTGQRSKDAGRYKLFNNQGIRDVVLPQLSKQLAEQKLCLPDAKPKLCLAAAHIYRGDEKDVQDHFGDKGWELFGNAWLEAGFRTLEKCNYENDVAIMAAKLAARARKK